MGEYARLNGDSIKLGTCEDLYYVTQADIVTLSARGWKDDAGKFVRSYLSVRSCRVRLPKMGELAGDVHTIGKREMNTRPEYTITLDGCSPDDLAFIDHSNIYHNKAGVNFIIPCPYGASKEKVRTSPLGPTRLILTGEGLGVRRAIYRCPFCDCQFNLNGHPLQYVACDRFRRDWLESNDAKGLNADGTLTYIYELMRAGQVAQPVEA